MSPTGTPIPLPVHGGSSLSPALRETSQENSPGTLHTESITGMSGQGSPLVTTGDQPEAGQPLSHNLDHMRGEMDSSRIIIEHIHYY